MLMKLTDSSGLYGPITFGIDGLYKFVLLALVKLRKGGIVKKRNFTDVGCTAIFVIFVGTV